MQEKTLYTTGEFAKRANISVRTIRYYDDKELLKPSEIKESGYRFYTDSDFAKLQKIIVLKRLGFSLEDIASISKNDMDANFVKESFDLQLKLVRDKITELKQIEQTILGASHAISDQREPNWNKMIGLIHLLNMEENLVKQYKNSKNLKDRIHLHDKYSNNMKAWFPWIFEHLNLRSGIRVLETGCGNGQLWKVNLQNIPQDIEIILSDLSPGMIRDAKSNLKSNKNNNFTFQHFDFHDIPFENESFDMIIVNHSLFYAKDREKAIREHKRVLKKDGYFFCSTYGKNHMKEIELLVKEFDERIALSEIKLYDIFGLDNGEKELSSYFTKVKKIIYEDSLCITDIPLLAEYIYSCHGNQMEYLLGRQVEFEKFLFNKVSKKGFHVTKDAGIFCCR